MDSTGIVYFADQYNCVVRKVDTAGTITTIAGIGNSCGYSGDGGKGTAAQLYYPAAVALDSSGNLFIADTDNCRVRKLVISSNTITTYAGNGTCGYTGDGSLATGAEIYYPQGLAADSSGDLFIADTNNYVIREVAIRFCLTPYDLRSRIAEERLRQLQAKQASNLTEEVCQYLQAQVSRQRCKAESVARMRHVDRRTLSRRLRAEGTTFRQLAGEAQFRVAKQLLVDTGMSLTQISAALNFSELAAFTHAFRRWSGMTPSAWRHENRPTDTIWPLKAKAKLKKPISYRKNPLELTILGRQVHSDETITRSFSKSEAPIQI